MHSFAIPKIYYRSLVSGSKTQLYSVIARVRTEIDLAISLYLILLSISKWIAVRGAILKFVVKHLTSLSTKERTYFALIGRK